ncbi:hypothetical protein DFH06DRAFT_505619 [Mycena polygramma]|nr:hypothetical protein DFH06DRAFT_505619 [Mycena polygramma]
MAQTCWKCGAPASLIALATSTLDPPTPPPDLARFLHGNNAPLDGEIPFLRNSLSAAQKRVDALDLAVEHAREVLEELMRKRKDTVDVVSQHRGALSPVRRMPEEMLCEIFGWSLVADLQSPWRLARVCQTWRNTALEYGHLWSAINLPCLVSSNSALVKLEAQLQRSGNADLNVRIVERTVVISMLQLAVRQSHRWRTLQLALSNDTSAYELRALWHYIDSFPRLELLVLFDHYDLSIPDVFAVAPELRKVILTDIDFKCDSERVAVPWSQITHYRAKYTLQRHLEILTAAHNLQECSIGFEEPDVTPLNTIVLPHLRRLRTNHHHLLRHITAPALEDLVLNLQAHILGEEDLVLSEAWTTPVSQILLPFAGLKRLTLFSCQHIRLLIPILRNLPLLTHLVVASGSVRFAAEGGSFWFPASLFDALRDRASPEPLCPNLTSIVYGYGQGFVPDPFFAMVQSRFPGRLSFVRIYNNKDDPSSVSDAVSKAIRTGMETLCAAGLDAAYVRYDDPLMVKARKDYF